MALLTLQQLKTLWITGYKPTEQDFKDMFDSLIVLGIDVDSVNGLTGVVPLTGTANRITISGANTFDIATSFVGQSAISTLGTITTGVWTGTPIANANLANTAVANLTGTNTGDNTVSTSGAATTAVTLLTPRAINGVDFDGSAAITVTAAASTLTGSALNSPIVTSSLTSVGTLTNLTVTNTIIGSINGNAATATNQSGTNTGDGAINSLYSGLAASKQDIDSDLTTIAGLTATTNNFLVSVASAWASRTPTEVKTTLAIAHTDVSGLGTLSTQSGTFSGTSSGTNTGDITLAAIGATPNANSGTLTGTSLNLEPASASFGGVVTTGTQSFAGVKTFAELRATQFIVNILANRQTSSYTLVLTDESKVVEMNLAGANTLSIPTNANVAFEIGTQILITQYGAGQTTINGAGVTIRSDGGKLKINTQYSAATLIKIATNEWYLFGNLAL